MTQFSTNANFSTDANGTQATADSVDGNEANLTNFTVAPLATDGDLAKWTITTGGGEGASFCRQTRVGTGLQAIIASSDEVGVIATGDEFDVLLRFKAFTSLADLTGINFFQDLADNDAYVLRMWANGDARLYYSKSANYWTAIGALQTLGLVADTWYWLRVHRMGSAGAHDFSWKLWAGSFASQPGSWTVGDGGTGGVPGSADMVSGRLGVGHYSRGVTLDYDWFSVGTAGDAAPGPVGAGFVEAIPSTAMPAPIGGVADLALNFVEAIPSTAMPAPIGGVAGLDILRDIVITNFSDINGVNWISRANLHWIWCEFDLTSEALDPLTLGASVVDAGTNAATDGSGTLTIPVNTILTSGATGTLIVFDPTGGETLIRAVAL